MRNQPREREKESTYVLLPTKLAKKKSKMRRRRRRRKLCTDLHT